MKYKYFIIDRRLIGEEWLVGP